MSLADRSVLLVGAGGLGCPAAVALAAAGVGRITVVDDDVVEATNLSRQMLYGDGDVGTPKAEAASLALAMRFPPIAVTPVQARFGRSEVSRTLVRSHDVVVDGSDNFATRFAVNDLCVETGVPLVHGAAIRWLGQLMVVVPGGPCLRCVFEDEPPEDPSATCARAGVISPLVGVVGGWMAEAALRLLRGETPQEASAVRVLDAFAGRERLAPVGRDPSCGVCGRSIRKDLRAGG